MLSEYSYDPNGLANSEIFNLVQGSFTFLSGWVAKTGQMKIGTPTATMKIDGTAGGGDVASNNGKVTLYIFQQDDGLHQATILDQNGNPIGTLRSDGGRWVLTPTAPGQFSADEQGKTDAEKAWELDALNAILRIKDLGDQLFAALSTIPTQTNAGSSYIPAGLYELTGTITPLTIILPVPAIETHFTPEPLPFPQPGIFTTPPVLEVAPVATPDSYVLDEDGILVVAPAGVLANDPDANNDPLTALLIAGPQHGTLTLNANGSFVYAPDLNYNGTDGFTYRAYDGILSSSPAAVALTINAVNDAPVLSAIAAPAAVVEADDASAQDIAAISGTLPVSDRDVGDTLSASVVSASVSVDGGGTVPAVLAAILTASGALNFTGTASNGGATTLGWTYDPAAADLDFLRDGQTLTTDYEIKVGDAVADSGTQHLIITITGTDDGIDLATLTAAQGFRIFGADAGDRSGFSVSSAGDVNGDGFDDLIVGARGGDASGNAKSDAGESYRDLRQGVGLCRHRPRDADGGPGLPHLRRRRRRPVGLVGVVGRRRQRRRLRRPDRRGAICGDAAGNAKPSAGESYRDLRPGVGLCRHRPGDALTAAQGFRIFGADAGDQSGSSVSSAGDVNGDGFDDLIVGADMPTRPATPRTTRARAL